MSTDWEQVSPLGPARQERMYAYTVNVSILRCGGHLRDVFRGDCPSVF